jgi:predicted HicB family RNase H-like nuclease
MAQATVQFTCKRCGHDSSSKSNLLTHLRRKKPCKAAEGAISIDDYIEELLHKEYNEKTYDCEFCSTKFNSRSNKSRHKKTCEKALEAKQQATNNVIIQKLTVLTEQNTVLLQQNSILSKRLQEVESKISNNVNKQITNNNVTNNIININLNNFGDENISYLTPEFLSYCIMNPRKGMTSLIENIHYNNSYPENQNIRCKSLKQNMFEKFVNSEWRACDATNTLDELIRKGYRILNTHYTDNLMNDPEILEDEIKQRAYEKFRFLSDPSCQDYFAVRREIRLLIKDRTMYLIASPEENSDIMSDVIHTDT